MPTDTKIDISRAVDCLLVATAAEKRLSFRRQQRPQQEKSPGSEGRG